MKFGPVPIADAIGATAVHSIRQGDFVLKKGTRIGPSEIAALKAVGIKEITVACLDAGDVPEDQAAAEIAEGIKGEGLRADRAFTGRCNLFTEYAGVLVVDKNAVDALNRIDEAITVATLSAYNPVVDGEMGKKGADLFGRRQDTRRIQKRAADELGVGGKRRGRNVQLRQLCQYQVIDEVGARCARIGGRIDVVRERRRHPRGHQAAQVPR